jgi:hypothetical protein
MSWKLGQIGKTQPRIDWWHYLQAVQNDYQDYCENKTFEEAINELATIIGYQRTLISWAGKEFLKEKYGYDRHTECDDEFCKVAVALKGKRNQQRTDAFNARQAKIQLETSVAGDE